MKIRRLRVLSFFSRLEILNAIKHLEYKELKNRSSKNEWVKNCSSSLLIYELKMINSSYELNIQVICDHKYCSKIATINHLIDRRWNKREKIVFVTMKSTNALILYWVSQWYTVHMLMREIVNHLLIVSSFSTRRQCDAHLRKIRQTQMSENCLTVSRRFISDEVI